MSHRAVSSNPLEHLHVRVPMALLAGLLLGQAFDARIARAGVNTQPHARIVAIVTPATGSGTCALPEHPCAGSGGSGAVTLPASAEPQDVIVYLVAAGAENLDDGLAGAQFGISYNEAPGQGIDLDSWTSCSVRDYPTGDWPASGSGNTLAWHRDRTEEFPCPRTKQLVLGWFSGRVYGSDRFSVIVHPTTGRGKVADCSAAETWLDDTALGTAGVGGALGDDPCGRPIRKPREVDGHGLDGWSGPRLLLHAVRIGDGESGKACGLPTSSWCTDRHPGLRVELPAPGAEGDDYWIYLLAHNPDESRQVEELVIDRVDVRGATVLEWQFCQNALSIPRGGWPENQGSIVMTFPTPAVGASNLVVGAFRVHLDQPGHFRIGGRTGVSLTKSGKTREWIALSGRNQVGAIGFASAAGIDPCALFGNEAQIGSGAPRVHTTGTATVQPATWSLIKSLVP